MSAAEVKRRVEIVGMHVRSNGDLSLSLRRERPAIANIDGGGLAVLEAFTESGAVTKEFSEKMKEKLREAAASSEDLRRQHIDEHSFDVPGDYMITITGKEYGDLMKPQVGSFIVVSLSVEAHQVEVIEEP